jgi:hypothetical protein
VVVLSADYSNKSRPHAKYGRCRGGSWAQIARSADTCRSVTLKIAADFQSKSEVAFRWPCPEYDPSDPHPHRSSSSGRVDRHKIIVASADEGENLLVARQEARPLVGAGRGQVTGSGGG